MIGYISSCCGRSARSGEQGKEGDAGYEVQSVTMCMETVDSDQDFEDLPPFQVDVDFLSMLISLMEDTRGLMARGGSHHMGGQSGQGGGGGISVGWNGPVGSSVYIARKGVCAE